MHDHRSLTATQNDWAWPSSGVLDFLARADPPMRWEPPVPTPPVRAATQRAPRRWLGLATPRRRHSQPSDAPRSPSPQPGDLDGRSDAPTQTAASTARGYVDLTPLVQAAVVELRTHTTLDVRDRPLPIRGSSLALRRALDTLFVTLDRAESTGIEAYLSIAAGRHAVEGPAPQVHLVVRALGARLGAGAVARIATALVNTQPPGASPRLRVSPDRVTIDTAALAVESGPEEVLVATSWPVDLG